MKRKQHKFPNRTLVQEKVSRLVLVEKSDLDWASRGLVLRRLAAEGEKPTRLVRLRGDVIRVYWIEEACTDQEEKGAYS